MAETIISPGVFTRENDISFIQPAPVAAGAAIIGPAVKGPVEVPTLVTSYNDYVRKFGTTFASGSTSYEFLTSVAVKNYFQQGGNSVLVSRVVTGSFSRATATNITNTTTTTGASFASGSVQLAAAFTDGLEARIVYDGTTYRFIASANPVPADDTDGYVYFFSTGSSATETAENLRDEINEASALQSIVSASNSTDTLSLRGASTGTTFNLITFSTGSVADFTTQFTLEGGTNTTTATTNSFLLETLGKGTIYNNSTGASDAGVQNTDSSLVSGSADNVRWEISNINNKLGTFTLSIRQGNDSLKNKVVLETFNNLSLDPNSENYIEKVVGNQYKQINTSENPAYIETIGEYVNRSNYVRVSAVNTPTLDYLGTDGLSVNTDSDNISYSASLPIAQSGSFYGATGNLFASNRQAKYFKNIDTNDTQGLTPSCYSNIISVLENTDDYVFNIISAPGLIYELAGHGTELDSIISLAETRGDCIAVVDLNDYGSTVSNVTSQSGLLNSSYAAAYWPWLQTQSATGRNEWIPASVVIPGVYAFTDNSSAPWFAPAGLVRGGIAGVIQAERRLTRTQRDTLYSNKVNPIASFPGQGISVFGQKTLQTKASALDRVNVRRLLIELKKFIGDQARNLVFEQNTIATRNRFLATVNPYLESVVQRQGLYAYRVVMDDTNNTADVVDRNQLIGQIFIQPAKTAEFIVLDFTIEPTGATFAG
jgi:phage tail sheath protein FI